MSGELVLLQIKITKEEKKRLKRLCVELDISLQEFIKRLIRGSLGDVRQDD